MAQTPNPYDTNANFVECSVCKHKFEQGEVKYFRLYPDKKPYCNKCWDLPQFKKTKTSGYVAIILEKK
jgi:hypothetical protein